MPAHSRLASGRVGKSPKKAQKKRTKAVIEVNQVTSQNTKHALPMEAGAGMCAVKAAAHTHGLCGTWSYVSFDMLRTDLVTIQGDPGSSG